MAGDEEKKDLDLEWEQRTLCSDESCIGTIGADGCCRECGKPFEGDLPDFDSETIDASGSIDTEVSDQDDEDEQAVASVGTDAGETTDSDDAWENRTLCVDESCIGVIGPDGYCKECGRPFKE